MSVRCRLYVLCGQVVLHQYPLHLVSYCADDKSDKKMFTFIAKEKDSDRHHCFVFDSERCVSIFVLWHQLLAIFGGHSLLAYWNRFYSVMLC